MREENAHYMMKHPELGTLVDGFITAVVTQKPTDLIKFGTNYFAALRNGSVAGLGPAPLVVAGPSGVGKGTLIGMLQKKFPDIFGFSVSHTTRLPRPGEEDGIHYNFVTKGEMDTMVKQDQFIEYANVHTAMYGTSKAAVDKVRSSGKICILDIDIQGVQNVKMSNLDCKYIFIEPPSIADLEARLRGRGTESEEKIQVRLANAAKELEYGNKSAGNFDANLVNNVLDQTFDELVNLLKKWYQNLK